ncbi:MAG: hypothetical protein K5906_02965 [Bacilli bacterium]|nr:hypothetical protein [Bacilli bacterium]
MIIASIKNFFKSLGFYFIPLGISAFLILIGLSIIIPEMTTVIQNTYQNISSSIAGATFDWNKISAILINKVTQAGGLEVLTDTNKLVQILQETAKEGFGLPEITQDVTNAVQACVTSLAVYVIGLIVIIIFSAFIGFVVLKVLLRRYLTDTPMIKAILVSILDAIITLAVMELLFYFYDHNQNLALWLIGLVSLIIYVFVALLEAYIFYGIGKVKFLDVINLKNAFTLIIGNLIIIAVSVGVISLVMTIPNQGTALIIVVPFAELMFCVLGLNAETYTSTLAKEGKIEKLALEKAEIAKSKEKVEKVKNKIKEDK